MDIREILELAREKAGTWAKLSQHIDEITGDSHDPESAHGRCRAWITNGVPFRFIPILAKLTGIDEEKIVMAVYKDKVTNRK